MYFIACKLCLCKFYVKFTEEFKKGLILSQDFSLSPLLQNTQDVCTNKLEGAVSFYFVDLNFLVQMLLGLLLDVCLVIFVLDMGIVGVNQFS